MLKLEHVSKTFNLGTVNEKKALQDLNLTVNDGDFITIIGGNGAGKSTTLNMIAGVYPIDCGYITIDNQDISLADEYKRAKFIGRVFQDPMMGTAANMEIQENLAMAFRRGKRRGLSWGISKEEKKQYHEALKRLDLGLETRMSSKVGLLSGGQRQAISLLMATMNAPQLLLLDEHTAALDPKTQRKIMQKTQETIEEKNLTALMITHNLSDAIHFGNRLIVMHRGEIVRDFAKEEKAALTEEELFRLMNALDEADLQGE